MSTAVAIWSVVVEPGKKTTFTAQADIRLTNATLDADVADEKSRTSVKLIYETPQEVGEDKEDATPEPAKTTTVLCSLTPGKIEQASLDIILAEDDEIEFEVTGKNTVHLSGNFVYQPRAFPEGDSDSEIDFEDDYDLREVSSDVEVDVDELESDDEDRFEEIKDEETSSKKRPRDHDDMEVEGKDGAEGPAMAGKSAQKKMNKKLKAENGEAVASEKAQTNGDTKKSKEEKKKEKKKEKKEEKDTAKPDGEKKEAGMKELPSGLQVKDVKVGSGKTAKKGDVVSMRYIGKFLNGKIFDQNTKGKPFSFKVGSGEVIKGWDEGIPGMQAGGERLLVVPAKLGYGNRKIDGIPAGSTLRFEVKLLEIK